MLHQYHDFVILMCMRKKKHCKSENSFQFHFAIVQTLQQQENI